MTDTPKTTALIPWFGCARMMAERIGQHLRGYRWVGIPFAGGMPELLFVDAPTIVVNDMHRHVINLANVLRDPYMGPRLIRRLKREAFHPDVLTESQEWCKAHTERSALNNRDVEAARHYFIACWMGRSGNSGINDEFNGKLSTRWNSNGGDSNTRYRSAVASMNAWRRILQKCSFSTLDVFEFLDRVEDEAKHALYCDPPFPGPGDRYKHQFSDDQHLRLAQRLGGFTNLRVVCRFYDHPLIRELYPVGRWKWHHYKSRKQSNASALEVILTNEQGRSLFDA